MKKSNKNISHTGLVGALSALFMILLIATTNVNGRDTQARLLGYELNSGSDGHGVYIDYDNPWESDDDDDDDDGGYEFGPQNRSTSAVDKAKDGLNDDDVSVPQGAIAVQNQVDNFDGSILENKDVICTQSNNYLRAEANLSDNKIYDDTTNKEVGEFTIVPTEFGPVTEDFRGDEYSKKLILGYVYPSKMTGGEQALISACYPPDFKSMESSNNSDETDEPGTTNEYDDDESATSDDSDDEDDDSDVSDEVKKNSQDTSSTSYLNYFSDLPTSGYYVQPAIGLAEKNFLPEEFINSKRIRPGENITRCELMEIVVRATGIEIPTTFEATFKDVPKSHSKAKYIYAAKNKGWINGKRADFFDCEGDLIRAEMAKIMANARGLTEQDPKQFADWSSAPDWAKPYIQRVNKAGIMTGVGDKKYFAPMSNLNIADTLTSVSNVFLK